MKYEIPDSFDNEFLVEMKNKIRNHVEKMGLRYYEDDEMSESFEDLNEILDALDEYIGF